VPEKIFGLTHFLDFFDRCHSLTSLFPPLAALGSLPTGMFLAARTILGLPRKPGNANTKPHNFGCEVFLYLHEDWLVI